MKETLAGQDHSSRPARGQDTQVALAVALSGFCVAVGRCRCRATRDSFSETLPLCDIRVCGLLAQNNKAVRERVGVQQATSQ